MKTAIAVAIAAFIGMSLACIMAPSPWMWAGCVCAVLFGALACGLVVAFIRRDELEERS